MEVIRYRQIAPQKIRADKKARKITFVASDGSRDTAGTVLNPKGWDLNRYNRNAVVGYQHKIYGGFEGSENPDYVIGKGRAYMEGQRLMVDVEFEPKELNEIAEKVYQKLLFGSLNAVSVGFLPKGRGHWGTGEESLSGSKPTYYYEGQELLEVSVVNIPSNPNALKKSFIAQAQAEEQRELRQQQKASAGSRARSALERCTEAVLKAKEALARVALKRSSRRTK